MDHLSTWDIPARELILRTWFLTQKYWPRAVAAITSGAIAPMTNHLSFLAITPRNVTEGGGIWRCKQVQRQIIRVQMQDVMIPIVPRPSGSETNPRVDPLDIGADDTLEDKPTSVIKSVNMCVPIDE